MKKFVTLAFVLVLLSTAVVVVYVRPVVAQVTNGTIYIKSDGSVEGTDKIQRDGNIYTFTDNIVNQSIIVERDNIVVDGAGYILQGTQSGTGLDLTGRSNITIRKMEIDAFHYGIWLYNSSNINVNENNITNNHNGIYFAYSSNNTVSENNITDNSDYAAYLHLSSNNTVYRNNVAGNWYYGIIVDSSSYNRISENAITFSPLGILLFQSSNSTVSENKIVYISECAIKLEASNDNSIFGNDVTTNNNHGIFLEKSSTNILSENDITNNFEGILLEFSENNTIIENTIANNYEGIRFKVSQNNRICKNNIARNTMHGVLFHLSSKNTIYGNTIKANNYDGIWLYESSNNSIYHTNFLDNSKQVHSYNSTNVWDNGVEGNYWSDYTDQDENDDGIGDTSYVIDVNNQDGYPLMGMFSEFKATTEHLVQTICNSTISDFHFNGTAISFKVSGENGTTGFCRICIPTALMNDAYKVFVNGTEVQHTLLPCSNSTHSYLYFTYNHSTQEVIISEFPLEEIPPPFWMQWWFWTIAVVLIVALAGAVYLLKKGKPPTPIAPTLPTEGTL